MRFIAILVLTVTFVAHFCLSNALMKTASCPTKCRPFYEPLCGVRFVPEVPNRCTFVNVCLLSMYICKTKQKWITMRIGACQDHSPNCGEIVTYFHNHSDLITYSDLDVLD